MDPITLGIAAAGLFAAKTLGKLGERTGDKMADSISPLREQIADLLKDEEGASEAALSQVERAPDSRIAVDALAAAIADAARREPGKAQGLAEALERAEEDSGGHLGATFQVSLSGRARVERIIQANRDVNIRGDL